MRTSVLIGVFVAVLLVSTDIARAGGTGWCSDYEGNNFPCQTYSDDTYDGPDDDNYVEQDDYSAPTPHSEAIDYYNQGNAQLRAGNYYQAERLYRIAINLYSRDSDFYNNLGAALFYQGRLDEAVAAYRRAGELGNSTARAYAKTLANHLREQNRYERIKELFAHFMDLVDRKKWEEAASAMRQSLRLGPGDPAANYNLALAILQVCRKYDYSTQEKYDCLAPALDAATASMRKRPGDLRTADVLSTVLYFMDRHKESALMLVEAWRKGADRDKTVQALKDQVWPVGGMDAMHYYRAMMEVAPNDMELRELTGRVMRNVAKQVNKDERVELAREYVELFPNRSESYTWLGETLIGNGELRAGKKAFAKAIKIDPVSRTPHSNMGLALYNAGEFADAARAFAQGVALEKGEIPEDLYADYALMGVSLERTGNFAGAEAAYVQSIAFAPDNAYNHLLYGELLEDRQRVVEAERAMRVSLENEPESEDVIRRVKNLYKRLGERALEAGRYEAADRYLAKAAEMDPENETLRDALNHASQGATHAVRTEQDARAEAVNKVAPRTAGATAFKWPGKQDMPGREKLPSGGTDTSPGKQVQSAVTTGKQAVGYGGPGGAEHAASRAHLLFDTQGVRASKLPTASVVLGKAPSDQPPPAPAVPTELSNDRIVKTLLGRHQTLEKALKVQAKKVVKAEAKRDASPEAKVALVRERAKQDQIRNKLNFISISVVDRLKQLQQQRGKAGKKKGATHEE